jgi:hypothetical protein
MTNDEIILGITRLLLAAPPDIVPRIRIAVTYEEWQALEEAAFAKEGCSTSRIRNVPLHVEPSPDAPPLAVRYL